MEKQSRVRWAQRRLERWRADYGGRGRPIPEHLWSIAVEVARAEGVESTALALLVDRERLARRVALACEPPAPAPQPRESPSASFVELDAHGLCVPAERAVLRFEGRDGEKFELELTGARAADVVELARAFWSRSR
jgi:hypothetical protein